MLTLAGCSYPARCGFVLDEETVLSFVRSSIKSAWSLEALLLLHRDPKQAWSAEELVHELRGSLPLVNESVAALDAAGLVAADAAGARYQPRSPELGELADALVELYREKPITVLRTIFTSPSDKIRSFSDAFLFRKGSDQ